MKVNKYGFENNGLLTLFEETYNDLNIRFGTVTIAPGERVPKKGLSNHEENEYSIIVKGEIEGESGGAPFKVLESHATFIPAGERHWSINSGEEPCKIVWALVKEN